MPPTSSSRGAILVTALCAGTPAALVGVNANFLAFGVAEPVTT